ncbi:hypothetical protein LUZ61_002809 [Rhynchospora tenuis]|uniref:RIC1 C-terminal alpha solenoid region domain-containing protein n=1 Tax=Rhynchospora tenuis TaxID=198213 RepID=A0AAD5ZK17_9POAL|nr:hypothetical protein LUZ61_002809 [Rhynchospora tenuis]
MYMAYGWPQAIPLDPGLPSSSSERVVYLKSANRLLLIVGPTHLELWSTSQHKLRLGKYVREEKSVAIEGENARAVWSPDTKTVAVLTTTHFLHIYKIQLTGKRLLIGGKHYPGLFLASISLNITEAIPLFEDCLAASNFVCDSKSMLIGLSNGQLRPISWNAEYSDSFRLCCENSPLDEPSTSTHYPNSQSHSTGCVVQNFSITHLEYSTHLRILVVLYSNGQIELCSVSKKGLRQSSGMTVERWLTTEGATCTSFASDQKILAVGCGRGVVELYDLSESGQLLRTISLFDWGYTVEDTGPVSCIAWTPDNCAFAVGWRYRGMAVWSVSGCRLMCTARQIGLATASSPMVKPNADFKPEPLIGGTAHLQWDEHGYRLFAVEENSADRAIGFSFSKCCLNRGLSRTTFARQFLYSDDRVLLIQHDGTDELKILQLNVPVSYISQNWPILHVVASDDGTYLAVAGHHGLVLYDLRNKKWRFFGDVTQEQNIQCKGLLWLGNKIIVVCNYIESSNTYELLFYPRYHLDQSSLLCRKTLLGRPIVMDVFQDYVLVTYNPFDVHIFHVKISGELSPTGSPVIQLNTVRELSIMSVKSHPAAMHIIPDMSDEHKYKQSTIESSLLLQQPSRCLILRKNGELSLLDLDDGHEQVLTNSVDLLWVTCGKSEDKANLIKEVSWLDYGHRGMQVWYPSHSGDPFKQEDFLQLDPELEFDREIYPLGLLPNVGVVVGVTQRMSFSTSEFPCFEPIPQAQTILHCLLRHLLQREKSEEALRLAYLSAEKPHFSHCLEWLLFTVFDAEISRQSANKNQTSLVKPASTSLLEKTCDLLRNFPEYYDVVVSVARKTDGRHWADLFSAAGRSTELFEECFQRRWYRTAACYILVIAKLEGPAVSQYCALRLLQATLDESLYELAGELVRFLLRSGREFENSTSDSERLSPRFLGYFLFRSPSRRQSSDLKSGSFKELSPHIASVKNILESHASYLMSGKELSKLVAFVKGTQFDIVEYLQRERLGSARLDNFASALELIGQKLHMDTLQSRLDAEFLLAHMCSVKFKEWIVVLATLLYRAEVLVDLFRHDLRLWKAYSMTLQSHEEFRKYLDLLNVLEEQLSSVTDSKVQNGSL